MRLACVVFLRCYLVLCHSFCNLTSGEDEPESLEYLCDVVDPSPMSVKLWTLPKGFIPSSIDWCNCLSMHIKRISNAVNTNFRLSFQ